MIRSAYQPISDQSSFSRFFTRMKGVGPKMYRNEIQVWPQKE